MKNYNPFGINKPNKYNPFKLKGKKIKKVKKLSSSQRVYLWETTKSHVCHICGRVIYMLSDAELDHIKAKSKGGKKVKWSHRTCNRLKSSKSLNRIKKELSL